MDNKTITPPNPTPTPTPSASTAGPTLTPPADLSATPSSEPTAPPDVTPSSEPITPPAAVAPSDIYPTPGATEATTNPTSQPKAKTANHLSAGAFVALALFLGNIGVHDFVVGRKKQGIWHIILAVAPFIVSNLFIAAATSTVSLSLFTTDQTLSSANIVAQVLYAITVFNSLWVFVEAIAYARDKIRNEEFTVVKNSYKGIAIASIACSALVIIAEAIVLVYAINYPNCSGSACNNSVALTSTAMIVGAAAALIGLFLLICTLVMYKNILTADRSIKGVVSIKNWALGLFGVSVVALIAIVVHVFLTTHT